MWALLQVTNDDVDEHGNQGDRDASALDDTFKITKTISVFISWGQFY